MPSSAASLTYILLISTVGIALDFSAHFVIISMFNSANFTVCKNIYSYCISKHVTLHVHTYAGKRFYIVWVLGSNILEQESARETDSVKWWTMLLFGWNDLLRLYGIDSPDTQY